ncbi:hypothetical protein [Streptomyces sp. JJ66]|uniref:hypothetical protein n=1 Tax=Streptomyces sp. JJ66 TaxID=2803843 RepID=UPI0035AF4A98
MSDPMPPTPPMPLPWLVIRQEEDGSRYRVGRCATRVEAQRLADRLGGARSGVRPSGWAGAEPGDAGNKETAETAVGSGARRYLVERLEQPGGDPSGART